MFNAILKALLMLTEKILYFFPRRVRKILMLASLWCYRKYFDYLSVVISAYHDGISPKHIYNWGMHKFFLEHINQDMTILDIGCFDGMLTKKIAQKSKKVVAYDYNSESIKKAKKINAAENIQYFVGDALEDLPQAKFDAVILSSILTFVNEVELFLNRLHNLTNTLLIRETRYDDSYITLLLREFGMKKSNWVEYSKQELVNLLNRTGWEITDSVDTYDIFLKAKTKSG